jgi:uracil phosphoribosyltransferase
VDSLHVINHPVVADKVRQLRDVATSNADFSAPRGEISRFVAYEAFRDTPVTVTTVDTPVVKGAPAVRMDTEYVIVPILRAGLGMSPAVQEVLPRHRVCLVGLRRNEETLQTRRLSRWAARGPDGVHVVLCDPDARHGRLSGLRARHARDAEPGETTCSVSSRPNRAWTTCSHSHPDVAIVAAALDAELNDVGYITPGLGDAGDRLFGPPAR